MGRRKAENPPNHKRENKEKGGRYKRIEIILFEEQA